MAEIEIEIEVVKDADPEEFEENRKDAEATYAVKFEPLGVESPNGHPMFVVEGEKENVLEFLVQWYGMDEQEAKEIYPDLA